MCTLEENARHSTTVLLNKTFTISFDKKVLTTLDIWNFLIIHFKSTIEAVHFLSLLLFKLRVVFCQTSLV